MPLIRVEMFPGRTDAVKQELAARITEAFKDVCGSAPPDIAVMFTSVSATDWFVAGSALAAKKQPKPNQEKVARP